jgi:hypothetical protein
MIRNQSFINPRHTFVTLVSKTTYPNLSCQFFSESVDTEEHQIKLITVGTQQPLTTPIPRGRPTDTKNKQRPDQRSLLCNLWAFVARIRSMSASMQFGKAGQCSLIGQCTKPRCWKSISLRSWSNRSSALYLESSCSASVMSFMSS